MCRLGVKRGITTKELKTSAIFVTSRWFFLKKEDVCICKKVFAVCEKITNLE